MVGFPVAALLPSLDRAEFAAVDPQFTKNSPKSRGHQVLGTPIRDGGYLAGGRVMPYAVTAFALADFLTSRLARPLGDCAIPHALTNNSMVWGRSAIAGRRASGPSIPSACQACLRASRAS